MSNNTELNFEESITFQIDYTSNFNKSFRRRFSTAYIDAGLLPDEFAIIFFLAKEPDISQTTIAKYLFKGKAHVGKILKEMEQKGLIKRQSSGHSSPAKIILLNKAKEIYKKGLKEVKAIEIYKKGLKEIDLLEEKYKQEFTKEEHTQFLNFLKRYRKLLSSFVEVDLK